jgi:hypothetical protein
MKRAARLALLATALGAATTEAAAQPVAASLDSLAVLSQTRAVVTVTDRSGRRVRGRLEEASPAGLVVRSGDALQRIDAADVRSVRARREDSLAGGALIGAAVGGGLSSLQFLDNECRDDGGCFAAVAINTGLGALVGVAIDALIRRQVEVYVSPAPTPQPAITATAFVERGRAGARLTVEF